MLLSSGQLPLPLGRQSSRRERYAYSQGRTLRRAAAGAHVCRFVAWRQGRPVLRPLLFRQKNKSKGRAPAGSPSLHGPHSSSRLAWRQTASAFSSVAYRCFGPPTREWCGAVALSGAHIVLLAARSHLFIFSAQTVFKISQEKEEHRKKLIAGEERRFPVGLVGRAQQAPRFRPWRGSGRTERGGNCF